MAQDTAETEDSIRDRTAARRRTQAAADGVNFASAHGAQERNSGIQIPDEPAASRSGPSDSADTALSAGQPASTGTGAADSIYTLLHREFKAKPELQLRRDRPGMPHQVKLAERPQQKLERLPATKTQESSPGKKAEPVKTRSTPRGMRLFSLIPASGIPACSAGSSRAPMRHQLFPGIRPEAPSEEDSIWGRFSQRRRSAPQCRASPSRTRWTSSRGPSS